MKLSPTGLVGIALSAPRSWSRPRIKDGDDMVYPLFWQSKVSPPTDLDLTEAPRFDSGRRLHFYKGAGVAELVDAVDLKSIDR